MPEPMPLAEASAASAVQATTSPEGGVHPPVTPSGGASEKLSAAVLRELLEYASDVTWVADAQERIAYASPAVERMLGWTVDELVGRLAAEIIHPDDFERVAVEGANQILLGTEVRPIPHRVLRSDGTYLDVEARVGALPPGHPLGTVVVNARDISDRVAAEAARNEADQMLGESQAIVQMVAEGKSLEDIVTAVTRLVERRAPGSIAVVSSVDEQHSVVRVVGSPSLPPGFAAETAELPIEDGMGSSAAAVLLDRPIMTEDALVEPCWAGLQTQVAESGIRACWVMPIRSANARAVLGTLALYWMQPMRPSAEHLLVMGDAVRLATIVLSRARVESELGHRATHDTLTGLPNRALLYAHLEKAIAEQRRTGNDDVTVMYVDLDRFKDVNDRLGHAIGDSLLHAAADRLRSTVREVDTVARFGGDEFVILAHTNDVAKLADRMNRAMVETFPIDKGLQISCSIGVAKANRSDTPDAVLRRADLALYHAKQQGRNRFVIYKNSRPGADDLERVTV